MLSNGLIKIVLSHVYDDHKYVCLNILLVRKQDVTASICSCHGEWAFHPWTSPPLSPSPMMTYICHLTCSAHLSGSASNCGPSVTHMIHLREWIFYGLMLLWMQKDTSPDAGRLGWFRASSKYVWTARSSSDLYSPSSARDGCSGICYLQHPHGDVAIVWQQHLDRQLQYE